MKSQYIQVILLSLVIIFSVSSISQSLKIHQRSLTAGAEDAGGLVALYTFDDGTAVDYGGIGNHGTIVGNPTLVAGKVGAGAMKFDGIDDYIYASYMGALTGGDFSFSFWVKPDSLTGVQMLMSQFETAPNKGPVLYTSSSNLDWQIGSGDFLTGSMFTIGEWTHVVAIAEGSQLRVYRNGVEVQGSPKTITRTDGATTGFTMGGPYRAGISFFKGALDDVRIYSRVLTSGEVASLYALAGTSGGGTTEPTPPPTQTSTDADGQIYIAQNSAGANTGASCADAHSAAWFNTSTNWGTATGKISSGDTVHLCGIISTGLGILGSGTSGNPITILFESGAKMSAPHWNQNGVNGDSAIYGAGRSYVTVDGGTNGLIEATANGTALSNQKIGYGVYFDAPTGVVIKNLKIQNMYVRTPSSSDSTYITNSITVRGGFNDLTISGNTTSNSGGGIFIGYRAGSNNLKVFNNTLSAHGVALVIGSEGTGAALDNVRVYNNDLSANKEWSGHPDIHVDLLHMYAVQPSTQITNAQVYGNYFHGNLGIYPTAFAFIEGYVTSPLIYNNVFFHDTFGGGNGDLAFKGANGARAMNNTFTSNVGGTAIGTTDWGGTERVTIINNVISNYTYGVYDGMSSGTGIQSADYNLFYPATTLFRANGQQGITFAQWQAAGFDTHGLLSNPLLDGSYKAQSTSPLINAGTSLSTYFSTDKDGLSRPQGSAWDIGAFESTYSGPITPPPSSGSTYFIRPGGTGDGTSWANAWGNLGSVVWSNLGPGKTLCIAGGTYTQTLTPTVSGANGNPLTIKRATASDSVCGSGTSGWNSSYDSQVVIQGNPHGIVFLTSGLSYITVDGKVDRGIKIIVTDPSNINIPGVGVKLGRATNNIILKYLDIAGPDTPGSIRSVGDNRCIDTTAWTGLVYETHQNLEIANSYLHGCINLIYLAKVTGAVIERNKFYDAIAPSPAHTNVIIGFSNSNIIFRYNEVTNWNTEGILLNPTGSANGAGGRWDIYGNIWHDGMSGGTGVSTDRVIESQYPGEGPIYFYNNVVANTWAGVTGTAPSYHASSQWKNNIFWNIYGYHANYNPDKPFVALPGADYNYYDLPFAEVHSIISTQNPFLNSGARDYRLSANSPALNKGTPLASDGYINKDLTGATRGADGAWDIGAYETTGGAVQPTTYAAGDFNNDGVVNSIDFSLMAGAWNTNNSIYDLNKDGTVNTLDYSIMAQNWTK